MGCRRALRRGAAIWLRRRPNRPKKPNWKWQNQKRRQRLLKNSRRCRGKRRNKLMKSAYELAMERLNKMQPSAKLTDAQKKELAELDAKYTAKVAEREIFLKGELAKAVDKGDGQAYEQLEQQMVSDRKSLQAELEEK